MKRNKKAGRISDLQANHIIGEAIQIIARHGVVNPTSGVVKGTGMITGYVCKIHTEGELLGTVDVQEYVNTAVEDTDEVKQGLHEGVFLSAIQDNQQGMVIIPKLYSDVMVSRDPESGNEFITMVSHVDAIQLDAHGSVTVGVREREEFDTEDEESPDVHELKLTGNQAVTSYDKGSAMTTVLTGNEVATARTQDTERICDSVGTDKSSVTLDSSSVELKVGSNAKETIASDSATIEVGGTLVKVDGSTVYLGGENTGKHAVVGEVLCDTLCSILDAIIQIKTTTQLGPQPPLNIASFMQMKAQVQQYKGSISGLLTKVVQIKP